jgi:hypothetical protein
MVLLIYTILFIFSTVLTIYLVFFARSRDFLKFLTGAFFVSGGIQFYLYLTGVSVPLLGTGFVQTPELSGVRAIPHFVFFLLSLYFGFISKPRSSTRAPAPAAPSAGGT